MPGTTTSDSERLLELGEGRARAAPGELGLLASARGLSSGGNDEARK